jgi:hypothetical protein
MVLDAVVTSSECVVLCYILLYALLCWKCFLPLPPTLFSVLPRPICHFALESSDRFLDFRLAISDFPKLISRGRGRVSSPCQPVKVRVR